MFLKSVVEFQINPDAFGKFTKLRKAYKKVESEVKNIVKMPSVTLKTLKITQVILYLPEVKNI